MVRPPSLTPEKSAKKLPKPFNIGNGENKLLTIFFSRIVPLCAPDMGTSLIRSAKQISKHYLTCAMFRYFLCRLLPSQAEMMLGWSNNSPTNLPFFTSSILPEKKTNISLIVFGVVCECNVLYTYFYLVGKLHRLANMPSRKIASDSISENSNLHFERGSHHGEKGKKSGSNNGDSICGKQISDDDLL